VEKSLPGWLDLASLLLTVFLLWFGFSQLGLILHGLNLWRGESPFAALLEIFQRRDSQSKTDA
jgi:hypothetical protein